MRPGLGNGLGMLYNGYEANSPMLVTAGQQDRRMRLREPLLGHDLVAMAAPVVKWSVEVQSADEMAPILHRALKIAHDPPEGPVFVALPIDVLEQDTEAGPVGPSALYRRASADAAGIERAAALMASARRPVIVVGDGIARSVRRASWWRWRSWSARRSTTRASTTRSTSRPITPTAVCACRSITPRFLLFTLA